MLEDGELFAVREARGCMCLDRECAFVSRRFKPPTADADLDSRFKPAGRARMRRWRPLKQRW